MNKPKIFLFVNSGKGTDMQSGTALSEDGEFLAGHLSSCEGWAKHDMGLTSDWKHEHYAGRYPDGYELEWVDDAKTHEGVQAAYAKHVAAGKLGTSWQQERAKAKAPTMAEAEVEHAK